MKFDVRVVLENLSRIFKYNNNNNNNNNLTTATGTLNEDLHIFMTITRSFLLRMRDVSDKCCREK